MSESIPPLSPIVFGSLDRYKHVTRRIPYGIWSKMSSRYWTTNG